MDVPFQFGKFCSHDELFINLLIFFEPEERVQRRFRQFRGEVICERRGELHGQDSAF